MKKKTRKTINTKMSAYLPQEFIEALELIWNTERVQKSHQVRFALELYFDKYKSLLKQKGIDLWKTK